MIKRLCIENFKGIGQRAEIELRPVTFLFGPNSGGKSSIIHAMHLANELFNHRNLNPGRTASGGEQLDLGGFQRFVHGNRLNRTVRIGIEVDLDGRAGEFYSYDFRRIHDFLTFSSWSTGWFDSFGAFSTAFVELGLSWSEIRNCPYISEFIVNGDGEEFLTIKSDSLGRKVVLSLNTKHKSLSTISSWDASQHDEGLLAEESESLQPASEFFDDTNRTLLDVVVEYLANHCHMAAPHEFYIKGLNDAQFSSRDALKFVLLDHEEEDTGSEGLDFEGDRTASSMELFVHEVSDAIGKLIRIPLEVVEKSLAEFRYIGPIRETPSPGFLPDVRQDQARWSTGLAAWDLLYHAPVELVDQVSDWLHSPDHLEAGCSLTRKTYRLFEERTSSQGETDADKIRDLPTLQRVLIQPDNSDVELAPHEVGIGISQVIPVVVAALSHRRKVVAIEQPELHLHPRLQAELGDLFLSMGLGEEKQTFFLETHSEHLILRMLRRVRETSYSELPQSKPRVKPNDIAVYYLKPTPQGSVATPLRVDSNGDFIDFWPNGFFEERAKELF